MYNTKRKILRRNRNKKVFDTTLPDKFRNDLLSNKTDSEKIAKKILDEKWILYEEQKIFYHYWNWGFYIVDFFLPLYNMCLEIDGWYHEITKQKNRDKNRDAWFSKRWYKILRVKNKEVSNIGSLLLFATIKSSPKVIWKAKHIPIRIFPTK